MWPLALGGHSLLAAKLIAELTDTFGLQRVSVLDLYAHPTFGSLARKVAGEAAAADAGAGTRSPAARRLGAAPGGGQGPLDGRAWRILLATSSTRILNPRFLSEMASYDMASNVRQALVGDPSGGGVAIVGVSGRFPGAGDVDALWRVLAAGTACQMMPATSSSTFETLVYRVKWHHMTLRALSARPETRGRARCGG